MMDFARVIRPSMLPSWMDCARRQAARSFPGLIAAAGFTLREIPSHVGAAVGSGVHASAAATLKQKLQDGSLGDVDAIVQAGVETFDERIHEDGVTWDDTTYNRSTAHRQIDRMARSYRSNLAPEIVPVEVEERHNADVGDGWEISGQVDATVETPDATRDLKTGTNQRANLSQYGGYALLQHAFGFQVKQIWEDFLQRVRIDREQPPPVPTEIPVYAAVSESWAAIEDVKRSTDEFLRRVEAGGNGPPPETAFRANPFSVLCSDKFCPAHGSNWCRAHKGAR